MPGWLAPRQRENPRPGRMACTPEPAADAFVPACSLSSVLDETLGPARHGAGAGDSIQTATRKVLQTLLSIALAHTAPSCPAHWPTVLQQAWSRFCSRLDQAQDALDLTGSRSAFLCDRLVAASGRASTRRACAVDHRTVQDGLAPYAARCIAPMVQQPTQPLPRHVSPPGRKVPQVAVKVGLRPPAIHTGRPLAPELSPAADRLVQDGLARRPTSWTAASPSAGPDAR